MPQRSDGKRCAGRHHTWSMNPPTPGTSCTKCPAVWNAPARRAPLEIDSEAFLKDTGTPDSPRVVQLPAPSVSPPSTARAGTLGVDRSASLAERIAALRASRAPEASPVIDVGPPPPPPPPSKMARHMGRRFARLFDAATDALVERFKRKPNAPDEADIEDFEDAASEQFERMFPSTDASPIAKMALAGVFIVGEKWIGAEKLDAKPATPHLTSVPAHAADTSTPTPTPPPAPETPPAAPAPNVLPFPPPIPGADGS